MPPSKKGPQGEKRKDKKQRKKALVIVEVARATSDGRAPITRKDILEELLNRWKTKISRAALTKYVDELENGKRPWLKTDGHSVSLDSEDRILIDSIAIEALFAAQKLANDDDKFEVKLWLNECGQQLHLTEETCVNFLEDYKKCGYISVSNPEVEINRRAINEDLFYLTQAQKARLKKRPPRNA
jgi:hypothetical protein